MLFTLLRTSIRFEHMHSMACLTVLHLDLRQHLAICERRKLFLQN